MTSTHARHPAADVFGRVHVPLPTAEEAAAADRTAREQHGVPERVLMESAARAAALVLHRLHPSGRIVGVAGSGNNGGDLLVMMRVLRAWGRDTRVIAVGSAPPDQQLMHGDDVELVSADDADRVLARADIIVDGMLGTGARGAPRGAVRAWIERINECARSVIALDLPSGVDATTGAVEDIAIRAETTVSFGWPKLGLLLHPARAYCGRIVAVEIGFPERSVNAHARCITSEWARSHLRPRKANAHKGSAGRLLIYAGSEGMAGAGALAAEAAFRAGVGLIRIASPASNREILQTLATEATFLDAHALDPADLETMHVLVAGPGIGTSDDAFRALRQVLECMPGKAALLDADALNLLAQHPGMLRAIADERPLVITPHAKELARLTGNSIDDIIADAPAAARAAARDFGCAVLLKGQPSVIAQPDGQLWVNTVGSSDVATAGMGDQLAGVIGAMLGAGETPAVAAALGLYLSARAADIVNRGRSLTPRDVSAAFPDVFRDLGPRRSTLDLPFVTFDQPQRW